MEHPIHIILTKELTNYTYGYSLYQFLNFLDSSGRQNSLILLHISHTNITCNADEEISNSQRKT